MSQDIGCCQGQRMEWKGRLLGFGDIDHGVSTGIFGRELFGGKISGPGDGAEIWIVQPYPDAGEFFDRHLLSGVSMSECSISIQAPVLRRSRLPYRSDRRRACLRFH